MQDTDKSIAILRATQDGNLLSGYDVSLVQSAVNGNLDVDGADALESLLQSVTDGSYFERIRWLSGIQYLTKDGHGYVYWKGKQVEHYSGMGRSKEDAAAQRLAARCRHLESIDFPVNSRTVLFESCYEATLGTPWKQALQRYYTFFERNGRVIAVFFRTKEAVEHRAQAPVFSLCVEGGVACVQNFESGYDAFQSLQDREVTTARHSDSFTDVQSLLYRIGVTPERLQTELEGFSVEGTTAAEAAC